MRTATLIVAAVSSLSLAVPAQAQQRSWQGRGAAPAAPAASLPRTAVPVARLNPPQGGGWKPSGPRPGGWKPQPGAPRPGGWQPGRPPQGGWKPGRPGNPGTWQPGRPPQGGWKPGKPGGWNPGTPGGWGAYRRPVRGWTLPSYWIGGGFWVSDWSNWGLSSPPYGYNWVRYYDDAVLVDRGGRVWDSVSGVEWDRDDAYYADRDDGYYEEDRRDDGADYDAPGYDDDRYQGEEYREDYAPQAYAVPARPLRCIANCYGAGYYYGAPTTTTVVIQSAPVVTTTTTVTEEYVTYGGGRKVARRAPTKKLYRAPVKSKTCYCR